MTVGLLRRGDVTAPPPATAGTAIGTIIDTFARRDVRAEAIVYDDTVAERVREQLLGLDAVLVWVDPIVRGQDRSVLDAVLRDVAGTGVIVSAHPDVIVAMGTKEVLHRTRDLPWGTDTTFYPTLDALRTGLVARLRSSGVRVLKQDRGSGGNGVWRLELIEDAGADDDAVIRVQSAERGVPVRDMPFAEFVEERRSYLRYFAGRGTFVDQPYCDRLSDGMTRCYVAGAWVAGFGHQYVTALLPPASGSTVPPDPEPRRYYDADEPRFQRLRRLMDETWIPLLARRAGLDADSLPVIWDADFLLGPSTPTDDDPYILCEINVSGVLPIPDGSIAPLVDVTIARIGARHAQRRAAHAGG